MPERPLLILPSITHPAKRLKKTGQGGKLHLPSRQRQEERLAPQFNSLQNVINNKYMRLATEAPGIVPEEVIVFETVGPIEDFIVAVRNIEGLEWLGEVEQEDIPPDDDFFIPSPKAEEKTDKKIRGRLFLILTNQQAFNQLLSLWNLWLSNQSISFGLKKWGDLFSKLRDLRPWGVRDRLLETGVLDDWRERVEYNEEIIPCEIELWFRADHQRLSSRDKVVSIVQSLNGKVLHESIIDDIGYHALLAQLPINAIKPLVNEASEESSLIQCTNSVFSCCWSNGCNNA